jgi:ribonucleoside-diphosphate reductase alpha chain
MTLPFTDLQRHYWEDRYALRGTDGKVAERDITETWLRVADAISEDEDEFEEFYELLKDFKFVPGGRILAGAGAEADKTFYNCYVIPVETAARRHNRKPASTYQITAPDVDYEFRIPELRLDNGADSREAIFDTISTMVSIMSRGGGVGINWSVLRPRDAYLTRVSGHSSGPIGWMDVASTAVGEVIQGGSRRGAAMFMLNVWHPDVIQFINAKKDNSKITNANVSVGITDAFMRAVEDNEDWTFIFPDTTHWAYDKHWTGNIDWWIGQGFPVVGYDTLPARDVWALIAHAAHASGEPGVIFLDRYNALSTANGEETIICVNPCGEQGLGAYSVCNLGSMNLYAYIKQDWEYDDADGPHQVTYFDEEAFSRDVRTAIRFLDNVIDNTPDYLDETKARQDRLRRIGLGAMGLADALVSLGYRYGSPEAVRWTKNVFMAMKDAAIEESMAIADRKGPAKAWNEGMAYRPYLIEYTLRTGKEIRPMRNIFLLTQAPTGTTSLLAGVNSGIEPYFALRTWREDRTGARWVYASDAVEKILKDLPEGVLLPQHIVTAKEVTVDEHIAMQAAVQMYVDSSVSKTINAPNSQTVDETERAFSLAYDSGLKGIAYYRDGSREKQVLYNYNPNERIAELEEKVKVLEAKLTFKEKAHTVTSVVLDTVGGPINIPMPVGSDCPSCEKGQIVYEEGCQKCYSCGWSAC